MKQNQEKFDEIKNLLLDKIGYRVDYAREKDGTEYLNIRETNFWISATFEEFVVGYGLNHTHFSEEQKNLDEGVLLAIDLLTNRIKTTNYIKGNTLFKTTVEIEYPDSTLVNIGSTNIILFPFWKKTKIETIYDEKILEKKDIENEVHSILNPGIDE
ncbi:type I phosphoribosyltransferase [Chryseobacterium cheonjiense]|uniref:Uncharacterized protein n=1 Tax=Chryseobacterium cheonjiense TaxID=2728845 RepID=A0A7Y0A9B5_9FLAO|nr:hypothetical protein [Chryseobacterium cheonjiense]NML58843.1 hypothetical protein [Chryseobacterium cheonjiense]